MPSEYRYHKVDKYVITAKLTQPMHVGSASDDPAAVLMHPVTGYPFIQASSIAGACRSFLEKSKRDCKADVADLFGIGKPDDNGGLDRLKFTDGYFLTEDSKDIELFGGL